MNRRNVLHLWAGAATLCITVIASAFQAESTLITESSNRISYRLITSDDQIAQFQRAEPSQIQSMNSESGLYFGVNSPTLPTSTRYIQIRRGSHPQVLVDVNSVSRVGAGNHVTRFNPSTSKFEKFEPKDGNLLYPETNYTVGEPVSFRGTTLLPVTVFPVQYDSKTNDYIFNSDIEVTISGELQKNSSNFVGEDTRVLSKVFSAFTDDNPVRDELTLNRPAGSYLVVAREECLPYAIPLLEWKRQAGYSVEVIAYPEGTTANTIKVDVQAVYDEAVESGEEPFEYLLIIGDRELNHGEAPWTMPSFTGVPSMEGIANHADFMYGLLDNPDDESYVDVAIGRITAGSEDRMELAVNRQLAYEKTPDMEHPEWFVRAGVACQAWGDEGANLETFNTVRWGEETLRRVGFQNILRYENENIDNGGTVIAPVMAEWFNQGLNVWIGRAQIMGWVHNLEDVEPNVNGHFPYGVTLCGHGEFPAEWIYGEGDGENLKGAVIWMTGWGQIATQYNNGIWQTVVSGLYNHDLPIGWARTLFGLQWQTRFPNGLADLPMYQTDVDLYGDPGLLPWTAVPKQVEITFEQELTVGTNYLGVMVTLADGNEPIEGVTVTLYAPGQLPAPEDYPAHEPALQLVGMTDADGNVAFNIEDGLPVGVLYVTATGRNICPVWQEIDIADNNRPNLVVENVRITSGRPRSGSQFTFGFSVRNVGNRAAENVSGQTESHSLYTEMDVVRFNLGDIAAGQSVEYQGNIPVTLLPETPDGVTPELVLVLTTGDRNFRTLARITTIAPLLSLLEVEPSYQLGRDINLAPRVSNNGHANFAGGIATLVSDDWRLEVVDGEAIYPRIQPGQNSWPANQDRFVFRTRPGAIAGEDAKLRLILSTDSSYSVIPITIDLVNEGADRGPEPADAYGYTCLNDSDTNWVRFPFTNWEEIASVAEGLGTIIPLGGGQLDSAFALAMPFPFKFYGETFDSITVCDNGFISVGSQVRPVNFENARMELATGGAAGMIAPFWDNLTLRPQVSPVGVYSYYDEEKNRFIIEWFNMHPKSDLTVSLNFQVQILDVRHYPTVTGDNPLLFHYKTITNVLDERDPTQFASVGISSPDGKTGLGVNFDSTGTAFTPVVRSGSRLLFVTTPKSEAGDKATISGAVAEPNGRLFVGESVRITALGLGVLWETITDDNGEFRIEDVLPGIYYIEVRHAGFNPIKRELTILNGDELSERMVMTHPTPIFSFPYSDREIHEHRDSLQPPPPILNFPRGLYIRNRGNGPLNYYTTVTNPAGGVISSWFRIDIGGKGVVAPGELMTLFCTVGNFGMPSDTTVNGFVTVIDSMSGVTIQLPIRLNINVANGIMDRGEGEVYSWSLGTNYPNPFNSTTRIDYSVASKGALRLNLYDTNGRLIRTLADVNATPGNYSLSLDADNLPPGIYLVKMEAGAFVETRKVVLVK